MNVEWLSIYMSALASGLLSLLISHVYFRVSLRSASRHHTAQLEALATRHAEQMERMSAHHAEQLLVLRTTLLAVEKDSGVEAARDNEGQLTGGLHHEGRFIAPPHVSPSAVATNLQQPLNQERPTSATGKARPPGCCNPRSVARRCPKADVAARRADRILHRSQPDPCQPHM